MYKKIMIICWLFALMPMLLTPDIQGQYLVSLPDAGYIELALDYFIKAIQETDTAKVTALLGTETVVKGTTIDPGPQIRSIFEQAEDRQTSIAPPQGAQNFRFWDLEITDLQVKFDEDSTQALVDCKLRLWASEVNSLREVKQTSETFTYKKIGKGWHLVGFDNLLDFLWEEVRRYEED
jgi:hypothetical protein